LFVWVSDICWCCKIETFKFEPKVSTLGINVFNVVYFVVGSYWCCGRLLLGSSCSSGPGLWSVQSILCCCGSGSRCCGVHVACWCYSCLPGCKVPTDLWYGTKDLLSCSSSSSSFCSPNYYVYGHASWTSLPDPYVVLYVKYWCFCWATEEHVKNKHRRKQLWMTSRSYTN